MYLHDHGHHPDETTGVLAHPLVLFKITPSTPRPRYCSCSPRATFIHDRCTHFISTPQALIDCRLVFDFFAMLFLTSITILLATVYNAHGQQAVEQGIFGTIWNSLVSLDGSSMTGPKCLPYPLPNGYSFQDFCKNLSLADDKYWDNQYRISKGPGPSGTAFPLKGCVLGCLVGKDSFANGNRWGAGAWSGKCIRDQGQSVVNLLTPLPSIGGVLNVLDIFNWSSFLPVIEQYPGSIGMGSSWWDAFYQLPNGGRIQTAWTITYDDVAPPSINANSSVLERTVAMYAQLVRGSRDEVRQVAPGFLLGQVFRRPNSYLNPMPIPFNSNVRFALFQVCDKRGNYASGGNQRYLRPS